MIWLLLLTIISLCWWVLSVRHPKKFPPGPRSPLPFAGDVLSLKGNIVTGAERLQKIYGDVVGMWLGPIRTVFIHDYDMAVVRIVVDLFLRNSIRSLFRSFSPVIVVMTGLDSRRS